MNLFSIISTYVRSVSRVIAFVCALSVALPASQVQAWTFADAPKLVAGYFSPRAAQFVENNKRAVNITLGLGLAAITGYAVFTYLKNAKRVEPKGSQNVDVQSLHVTTQLHPAGLPKPNKEENQNQVDTVQSYVVLPDVVEQGNEQLHEEDQQDEQSEDYDQNLPHRVVNKKRKKEEEHQTSTKESKIDLNYMAELEAEALHYGIVQQSRIPRLTDYAHNQQVQAEELSEKHNCSMPEARKNQQSTAKVPYHHRHRKPISGVGLKLRHERLKSFSERLAEARKNNLAQKVHHVESVTVPEQMTLSMFSPDAREVIVARQKAEILRMSNEDATAVVENLIDKIELFEHRLSQLQKKNDQNSQQLARLAEDLIAASLKTVDSLGEFSNKKIHKEFIKAAQQYNRIHEIMSSTLELQYPITAAYLGEIKNHSIANSCKGAWKGMLELASHAKSVPASDNHADVQNDTWQLINQTTHQAWDTTISTLKTSARSVTDFVNDPRNREIAAEAGNAVIAFGGQLVNTGQSLLSAGINTLTSRFSQNPKKTSSSQQGVDDMERDFIDEAKK